MKSYCAACGGLCCKTMPGATLPEQWGAPHIERMREAIQKGLESGQWVLALPREARFPSMMPYVMPRLTERGCTFLGPRGCRLDETQRPQACLDFTAVANFPNGCFYPAEVTLGGTRSPTLHYAQKWSPYRRMLEELCDIQTALFKA